MKSPSEIQKGCGIIRNCEYPHTKTIKCKKDDLCPTCQALLEQAIEFEKEREKIDYLGFKKGDIVGRKNQAKEFQKKIENFFIKEDIILKKVDDKIAYLMISRNISHKEERGELIKLRQELLKEVQDNSQHSSGHLGKDNNSSDTEKPLGEGKLNDGFVTPSSNSPADNIKEVQDKPKYPNAFLGGYSEVQGEGK